MVQIISKNLFSTVVLRGARAYQEWLFESVDNGGSKIAKIGRRRLWMLPYDKIGHFYELSDNHQMYP